MSNNKIFILLPDGVGLRNFAFTDFYKTGMAKGMDLVFWNTTLFDLEKIGFEEIKLKQNRSSLLLEVLKNARKEIELNCNIRKSRDYVYDSYRFPFSYATFKSSTKSYIIRSIIQLFDSEKGLKIVRDLIKKTEQRSNFYSESYELLKVQKPALVFCTNQRISLVIAPLLAAQDLKIPTATFIFSWDNLPKGTMVVETDYYFVWSSHMKKELLYYYPYIKENQIVVTGTPQFENHFQIDNIIAKEIFFKQNGLDIGKKYICYSGDDVTTSPYDPNYLLDLIKAVRILNERGNQLGIIFRRCPVDFSARFNTILEENKDIVIAIIPKWDKVGEGWNTILPTKEDSILQLNIVAHTELVVNLGSSMVFDYVSHKKPCAFMNYNPEKQNGNWSVEKIYNYVHFRCMPNNAVVWLNSPDEISDKIEMMLSDEAQKVVANAQKWFEKINQYPAEDASKRIWEAIDQICKKGIC
ncbi:UDP-glycosyltransferase [Flavobacterium sp. GT3P67]|uniref:UDP-glycosyltransferase n=1 Tax=Flavobacterium sp. GT3P67 TaxID=2541722 RepID=UPI0010482CB5|nr:UDP-glycosyltransferase [Flavobacterium sp. GT3P67]TDE53931.1 UDP-glycosyltransferase [Flavobacterium sp. GT3P67]